MHNTSTFSCTQKHVRSWRFLSVCCMVQKCDTFDNKKENSKKRSNCISLVFPRVFFSQYKSLVSFYDSRIVDLDFVHQPFICIKRDPNLVSSQMSVTNVNCLMQARLQGLRWEVTRPSHLTFRRNLNVAYSKDYLSPLKPSSLNNGMHAYLSVPKRRLKYERKRAKHAVIFLATS